MLRDLGKLFCGILVVVFVFFFTSCHEKGTLPPVEQMKILGFAETPGYARGIEVLGDYAYVASGQAGVAVINISNPEVPALISSLDWVGQDVARGIYLHPGDTLLYLADTDDGVPIISVANLDSLRYVGAYWDRNILDIYGTLMDSSLFLCVADQDNGLRVLQAVGGFLVERGLPLVLPGTPRGVFARGHLCFVADAELGLQIVDIEDPDNKTLIGAAGRTAGLTQRVKPTKYLPSDSRRGFCHTIQLAGTSGLGWSHFVRGMGIICS